MPVQIEGVHRSEMESMGLDEIIKAQDENIESIEHLKSQFLTVKEDLEKMGERGMPIPRESINAVNDFILETANFLVLIKEMVNEGEQVTLHTLNCLISLCDFDIEYSKGLIAEIEYARDDDDNIAVIEARDF